MGRRRGRNRHIVAGLCRVERLRQLGSVWKERGGMSIFAHAQNGQGDRRRVAIGLVYAGFDIVHVGDQPLELGLAGVIDQQIAPYQIFIAVRVAGRNKALVNQRDVYLCPIEVGLAEFGEKRYWRVPARYRQACRARLFYRFLQQSDHGMGQCLDARLTLFIRMPDHGFFLTELAKKRGKIARLNLYRTGIVHKEGIDTLLTTMQDFRCAEKHADLCRRTVAEMRTTMIKNIARATIADVARQAGVSKATVSRFLNHRDTLLSEHIARRVEVAIAHLGYTPSPMAQALKRGRSRLIGLVVADITNPYSVAVLRGAEEACRAAGYLVMLFNLGNGSQRESAAIEALLSYQVEGFILNTLGHDTGVEAARCGKPVVLVDRLHQGLDVDFVSLDNKQAVGLTAQHLLDSGYTELLLVTEPLGGVSSRIERSEAFMLFIQDHDDAVSGCCLASDADEVGLDQALCALRKRAKAGRAAVIASNAVVTLRIVAAAARLDWQLGVDLGLIGIDETEWAPYVGPGISTVSQPTAELGRKAAECLLDRLRGSDAAVRKILLPGVLNVRGSSRALAR